MHTTNANECLNAQIWKRAPKHLPLGTDTVMTATSMAVLEYNSGAKGFEKVLSKLSMEAGVYMKRYTMDTTKKRRHDAANHSNEIVKKRRVRRKLFKAGLADEHREKEPVLYKSGGFND